MPNGRTNIRGQARELSLALSNCHFYKYLKAEKKNKNFTSKYHKKAFNHITKSIMRLNQIYSEDY